MSAPLFERFLDLRPLRGRQRGLVSCVFHTDQSPSLSIDLDKGVFHCFGCGAQGGLKRFAELIGEARNERPIQSRGTASNSRTAFAEALAREWNHRARLAPWVAIFRHADMIRSLAQAVDTLRTNATAAGPDEPATWDMLARAAYIERAVLFEAEVAFEVLRTATR